MAAESIAIELEGIPTHFKLYIKMEKSAREQEGHYGHTDESSRRLRTENPILRPEITRLELTLSNVERRENCAVCNNALINTPKRGVVHPAPL